MAASSAAFGAAVFAVNLQGGVGGCNASLRARQGE
jgi:hypothetical protein